jgi:hypothetical protein
VVGQQRRLIVDTLLLGGAGAISAQVFTALLRLSQQFFLLWLAGYQPPGLPSEGDALQPMIGFHGVWLIPWSPHWAASSPACWSTLWPPRQKVMGLTLQSSRFITLAASSVQESRLSSCRPQLSRLARAERLAGKARRRL